MAKLNKQRIVHKKKLPPGVKEIHVKNKLEKS